MQVTLGGEVREFEDLSLPELYRLQEEYCRETREEFERLGMLGMLATDRKSRRVPDSVIHARILELTPADQIITLGD